MLSVVDWAFSGPLGNCMDFCSGSLDVLCSETIWNG